MRRIQQQQWSYVLRGRAIHLGGGAIAPRGCDLAQRQSHWGVWSGSAAIAPGGILSRTHPGWHLGQTAPTAPLPTPHRHRNQIVPWHYQFIYKWQKILAQKMIFAFSKPIMILLFSLRPKWCMWLIHKVLPSPQGLFLFEQRGVVGSCGPERMAERCGNRTAAWLHMTSPEAAVLSMKGNIWRKNHELKCDLNLDLTTHTNQWKHIFFSTSIGLKYLLLVLERHNDHFLVLKLAYVGVSPAVLLTDY